MQAYISLLEEEREDYLISSKLKSIWNTELDLTVRFLELCKKYNIKTFSFAGTMLGAIRHKGFIPWDDDVDFALLRPDYEKLLAVAEKEFKYPYFFQTALNDRDFFFGYARLRNSETTGLIKGNISKDYNNGIYIDIFCLDGIVDDEKLLKKQFDKRDFFQRMASVYNYKIKNDKSDFIHKLYRCTMKVLSRFKSYEYWVSEYDKTLSMYNSSAENFGMVTHPRNFIKKYFAKKEDLDELIEMDFETIKIPVPKNYDVILRNMYGNYMQYPPIEVRGKWHNEMIEFDPYMSYKEYIEKNYLNR